MAADDPVFSHVGQIGVWSVGSLVSGMGPALAREATRRVLSAGPVDQFMVVGIADGLDPALPVGSLQVPARVTGALCQRVSPAGWATLY